MGCFICGRGNCIPSFHSLDEQAAYEPAETAYEKYLDVRAKCREDYENRCQIDEEDDQDEPDS